MNDFYSRHFGDDPFLQQLLRHALGPRSLPRSGAWLVGVLRTPEEGQGPTVVMIELGR